MRVPSANIPGNNSGLRLCMQQNILGFLDFFLVHASEGTHGTEGASSPSVPCRAIGKPIAQ